MCIYRIFQMQRKCINIGDLFFFAFAFIVIRCLWSVIQCTSSCVGFVWCGACKSRNRASESVEYIEFALFVYYVLFFSCWLFFLFFIFTFVSLFPFCLMFQHVLLRFKSIVLHRSQVLFDRIYAMSFFFLTIRCNCISCCALSEKPDLDAQEYAWHIAKKNHKCELNELHENAYKQKKKMK